MAALYSVQVWSTLYEYEISNTLFNVSTLFLE